MLSYVNDYSEGAHPKILERLNGTNFEQLAGYGSDCYCEQAKEKIRAAIGCPEAEIFFLVGGTQTNQVVLDALLRAYDGVIAAESGHINVHETGAIEATGHKVITVAGEEGKVTADEIRVVYESHWKDPTHEHLAQPAMVYISNPSEIGTVYTLAELEEIARVCRRCGLPLFMDGARLGYGLACELCDYTLADIAALCDVFYIGGTKVGALFGEAVVITSDTLKRDFRYIMKQRGGMLAKGRLLGIQFETLFEDGLYFRISEHAVRLAMKLRAACAAKGYPFLVDSRTNQQFPIFPDTALEKLAEKYKYSYWARVDETHSAVRLCTSWATTDENVDALCKDIASVMAE